MGENKILNDNRLYKIVNTKIIDKMLYILSARINTVSYNDMNMVHSLHSDYNTNSTHAV